MKIIERNDERGKLFLFGGFLAVKVLPYILHIVILLATKKSLGDFVYGICNVFGLLCGLGLGYLALQCFGFLKWKDYISCLSSMALAMFILQFGEKILLPYLAPHVSNAAWLLVLCYIVLAITVMVFMAMGLMNGLGKMKHMLIVMGICFGFSCLYLLLEIVVANVFSISKASFAANILFMILFSLVETFFIYAVLYYVRKAAGAWERKEYSIVKRNMPVWIAASVLFCLLGIQRLSEKPEDAIFVDIRQDLAYGDMALINENLDLAIAYYEKAFRRIELWKYVFDEEYDDSIFRTENMANDLQLSLIYWEKNEDVNAVRDYLLYSSTSLELGIKYLDMQHSFDDEMDGLERAIRDDVIGLMIANNQFRDECISLEALEKRERKILDQLEEFEVAEKTLHIIKIMSETGKEGKVTQNQVDKILDYADEYRDNLFIQRLAVVYGSALKGDNARHYERTINAAVRYEKLYSKMDGVTDENIQNCRITVAQWIIDLGDYNTALGYLEPLLKKGTNRSAVLMAARCYDRLNNYEKCREMAELILKEEPDNVAALYYCAITHLKNRNVDGALEYTGKICKVMEDAKGEKKHDAEICLYSMLQYLAVSDGSAGLSYQEYSRLSEEQKAKIAENPLFDQYIQAVYHCFYTRKFDIALECVNAVLDSQGDLSQALYLQGAILFGMKNFEDSINSYKKSIAVESDSPTVWYALANSYDALKRYEEAYEACLQVDKLLPLTDHEFDIYGVGIHNSWLMDRLENAMGGK